MKKNNLVISNLKKMDILVKNQLSVKNVMRLKIIF